MDKEEFLKSIKKALDKCSETERAEILYDYEEHFLIGRENGKTEEEICKELGNPDEIAENYQSSHLAEDFELKAKTPGIPSSTEKNRINKVAYAAILVGVLLFIYLVNATVVYHNKAVAKNKENSIQLGGLRIDSSGIHGDGISIDSNGVKVPGVTVDNNGVKVPGVTVDNNGVKVNNPEIKINIGN